MKKRPSQFYKEFFDLRSHYGEKEYGRDDILPATKSLLRKYLLSEDELLTDAAIELLDRADKSDDRAGDGLFPYDAHIALGGKRRISRGAMTADHHRRRKIVIDINKIHIDGAWANETKWLYLGMEALKDHPPSTVRSAVLSESGGEARAAE